MSAQASDDLSGDSAEAGRLRPGGRPSGRLAGADDADDSFQRVQRRQGRRHQQPTWRDKVLLGAMTLAFIWVAYQGGRTIVSDFQAMEARALVRSWAEGKAKWTVSRWVFARDSTLRAIQTTPDNPALYDQMGVIYLIRARDAWRSAAAQRELYDEAARHFRQSLALRPRHGWTWASLAEALQVMEPGSQVAWDAWRNAQRYTPYELPVQSTLLRIGFLGWKTAPDDVKAWMRRTYEESRPAQREEADRLAASFQVTDWRTPAKP